MFSYPGALQHFFENHLQVIAAAFMPATLMLINHWFRSWLGLEWRTYGADIAFCGVAGLLSAVVRAVWMSPTALRAAFLILMVHFLFWSGVVWLAAKQWKKTQIVCGAITFYSAVLLTLFYFEGGH